MSPVPARSRVTSGGRSIAGTEKKPGADVSRSDSASANTAAFAIEDAVQIDAQLAVSAIGAGASITVKLQTATDPATPDWVDAPGGAFPAQTGTTTGVNRSFLAPGNVGRWVATIVQGPTPAPIAWSIDTQARIAL